MTQYSWSAVGGPERPERSAQPASNFRRQSTHRHDYRDSSARPDPRKYRSRPVAQQPLSDSEFYSSSSEEETETESDSSDSDEEYERQQYLRAKAAQERRIREEQAAAMAAAAAQLDGAGDSRSGSKGAGRSRRDGRRRREEAGRSRDRDGERARRKREERTERKRVHDEKKRKRRKKRAVGAAGVGYESEKRLRGGRRKGGGGGGGGGDDDPDKKHPWWKRKKGLLCLLAVTIVIIIIAVPSGIAVAKKKNGDSASEDGLGLGKGGESNRLDNIDRASIPAEHRGGYFDPFSWEDTTDFNLTYTDATVGGLPIMGLFDDWNDSAQANKNVPPLNEPFPYGEKPIRGVNLGGWLLIEPFITPSFFKEFSYGDAVIDEYTLSKKYGINRAKTDIEKHYATWVTEKTLKEIRDAGLDHVRMPFGYWAVMQIPGDPYVFRTSWRYLLRAIEWARKYGLRVKIDLHSVPGGANGWNHSGRQNVMNWLIGPDGQKNGEKTLEIHTMMARFFAQPRYKNIVTMYGLVNEPRMDQLEAQDVIDWSEKAHEVIRDQGYEGKIVFGDGFRGLVSWKGEFRGYDGMVLDVHQYTIFNGAQISLTHTEKINFVCKTWAADLTASSDAVNGFGPTIVGEWGNADTDCTPYLNNVGQGTRWEGTLRDEQTRQPFGSGPLCPAKTGCSCEKANAAPEDYAPVYRKFLLMFAEAQMDAFENSWGWMYWTWDTEESTQWSYKKGMKAGIVPKVAYERKFRCGDTVPEFEKEGLPGTY